MPRESAHDRGRRLLGSFSEQYERLRRVARPVTNDPELEPVGSILDSVAPSRVPSVPHSAHVIDGNGPDSPIDRTVRSPSQHHCIEPCMTWPDLPFDDDRLSEAKGSARSAAVTWQVESTRPESCRRMSEG
jgi:hypothetical protein